MIKLLMAVGIPLDTSDEMVKSEVSKQYPKFKVVDFEVVFHGADSYVVDVNFEVPDSEALTVLSLIQQELVDPKDYKIKEA